LIIIAPFSRFSTDCRPISENFDAFSSDFFERFYKIWKSVAAVVSVFFFGAIGRAEQSEKKKKKKKKKKSDIFHTIFHIIAREFWTILKHFEAFRGVF
jgi:hypothetical protein